MNSFILCRIIDTVIKNQEHLKSTVSEEFMKRKDKI